LHANPLIIAPAQLRGNRAEMLKRWHTLWAAGLRVVRYANRRKIMTSRLRSALAAIVLLVCATLLASCVTYSVQPLYDERTAVFDASLLGPWGNPTQKNASSTMLFAKGSGDFYEVTMIDPNGDDPSLRAVYEAHAVRLNGRLFLDAVHTADHVGSHTVNGEGIRSHMIVRAMVDGDKMHIDFLSDDWLEKGFDSGTLALAHETISGNDISDQIVLTASTADLQKFVAAHANDDQAFPPSDPLVRLK
jgi:hypothetical protein